MSDAPSYSLLMKFFFELAQYPLNLSFITYYSPGTTGQAVGHTVSFALSIPTGTPLQVALDQDIHVKKVGQPIHGRIVEPVYAFDHIVIPTGSEVNGQVTKIGEISGGKRTPAVLDAGFTPERKWR